MSVHILTMTCPDRTGIVAALSGALFELGANIEQNAQFSDPTTATFCTRSRFEVDIDDSAEIEARLAPVAAELGGTLRVRRESHRPRVLIMVSRHDHCLVDLLYRDRIGELPVDLRLVVSNHPDLGDIVERDGIEFVHVPVDGDREAAERRLLDLVDEHSVDLVVLARYMQILGPSVCEALAGRIINIHHSFLPGFRGARPYHQAHERGVKLIGATAHYVTAELDEGPIISQDVVAVSHRDTPERMVARGRDIERLVLADAVTAHAEGRVFLLGGRTVVFD